MTILEKINGYLEQRVQTLRNENKQLNSELINTREQFSLQRTGRVEQESIAVNLEIQKLSVNHRILLASKQIAEILQAPIASRKDLDIFKYGRQLVQNVKTDKVENVKKLIHQHPYLLTLRSVTYGETIFHFACKFGSIKCCKLFLDFPLPFSSFIVHNKEGILMIAENKIVRFDHLVTDVLGKTPLHVAAEYFQVEICKLFNNRFNKNISGIAAPKNAAGLTPAGSSSLKKVLTEADVKRRNLCRLLLHTAGDPCISPKINRADLKGKYKKKTDQELSVAYGSKEMPGFRVTMEDAIFCLPSFLSTKEATFSLFGVLDGHGGSGASFYCSKHFPLILRAKLKACVSFKNNEVENCLGEAFTEVENSLKNTETFTRKRVLIQPAMGEDKPIYSEKAQDDSGTTLLVFLVMSTTKETKLFVANVGDCRAILVEAGKHGNVKSIQQLSRDHKPYDSMSVDDAQFFDLERLRIESAGGELTNDHYVLWDKSKPREKLNMTRSIGDFSFKSIKNLPVNEQAIVALPEISAMEIDNQSLREKNKRYYICLACDGIWDVMSNDEMGSLALKYADRYDLDTTCEQILLHCLEKNSQDNLSMILVKLNVPSTRSTVTKALSFDGPVSSKVLNEISL